MTDSPFIIQMNIAHYQALLRSKIDDVKRATVERLLAEAQEALALQARKNTE